MTSWWLRRVMTYNYRRHVVLFMSWRCVVLVQSIGQSLSWTCNNVSHWKTTYSGSHPISCFGWTWKPLVPSVSDFGWLCCLWTSKVRIDSCWDQDSNPRHWTCQASPGPFCGSTGCSMYIPLCDHLGLWSKYNVVYHYSRFAARIPVNPWDNALYDVTLLLLHTAVVCNHLIPSVLDFRWFYCPGLSKSGWIHHHLCSFVPCVQLSLESSLVAGTRNRTWIIPLCQPSQAKFSPKLDWRCLTEY